MSSQVLEDDAGRLEQLWANDFGNAYVERNRDAGGGRGSFWASIIERYPIASALEVGCNMGANLRWLAEIISQESLAGVDVNQRALGELKQTLPGVTTHHAPARDLPFPDETFDLVFTMGVLIHQSPTSLPEVMDEIVRCTSRYVLCGEYFAENLVEVPYRGHRGALYKMDFGKMYECRFPQLSLLGGGRLSRAVGFDDITYWMFEKV